MLKLELKKLHKSKFVLITILVSIIMSFYVNYRSNMLVNLSSEYSSYEHSTAEGIFTSNFMENKYKIMNRENYFLEFNNIFNYSYYNYFKLVDFINNVENKTFVEKCNISKEFFDISYSFIKKAIKYNENLVLK